MVKLAMYSCILCLEVAAERRDHPAELRGISSGYWEHSSTAVSEVEQLRADEAESLPCLLSMAVLSKVGSNEQSVPRVGWLPSPYALWTLSWGFTLIRTLLSRGTV